MSSHGSARSSLDATSPTLPPIEAVGRRPSQVTPHRPRGRSGTTFVRPIVLSPEQAMNEEFPPRPVRSGGNDGSRSPSTVSSTSQDPTSVEAFRREDLSKVKSRERRATVTESMVEPVPCATPDEPFFPPVSDSRSCSIDYEDLEKLVELSNELHATGGDESTPGGRTSDTYSNCSGIAPHPGNLFQSSSEPKRAEESESQCDSDDSELNGVDGPSPTQLQNMFNGPMSKGCLYSFFSSELVDTIIAPTFAGLLDEGETAENLFEPPIENDGVWWLDMMNAPKEAVALICKGFNVHPLTREDILTQETREKVELFKAYYFVCFRSFYSLDKNSEYYMEPVNVYAVVFREGLLTFSFCDNPHAANVRTRIGKLRDYLKLGADWICYALIDDIVDTFGPAIWEVEKESDSIEDGVLVARMEDSRELLQRITVCRKKVMQLIRLLGGKADVIKGFAKRCNERYEVAPRGDVGLYLSDIQDHVVTMMGNLGHFEKMLSRSHSNYLAQLSINNLQAGNRVNEMLGKVTLIATLLVPLNLVTGLFGMNVRVPGQDGESLGWFFGVLGFLVCVVFSGLCFAKKMRMI